MGREVTREHRRDEIAAVFVEAQVLLPAPHITAVGRHKRFEEQPFALAVHIDGGLLTGRGGGHVVLEVVDKIIAVVVDGGECCRGGGRRQQTGCQCRKALKEKSLANHVA